MPFKHHDALEAARWKIERIGRAMRGEETPQPSLDPELEALKKRMRINFPDAPTAGRSSASSGGNGAGRPLEVARQHDEQCPQQGGLEL
ncbi:hypothetical protein [Kocuria rosea]|uniref:hypothetical protein n=1 Tax=Kocuria rosea TaxID=1275 RepID=UPI002041BD78|nr:hypothetical protein [Kocuria rosea]